jgi:circadian clock protein KaiB
MTGAAATDRWALTLYVNGASPSSLRAIETARRICDDDLGGRADLEVIDIRQQPALSAGEQILVAPTLVRRVPAPLLRVVGDLSDTARVCQELGLDCQPAGGAGPGPAG